MERFFSRMRINIAEKAVLNKILERKKKDAYRPEDVDLNDMLREILTWANSFVPSESGSILLDDPVVDELSEVVCGSPFEGLYRDTAPVDGEEF